MKKRIAAWIYILLALALCLTPGLGLLIAGPSEAGANEVPARLPELTGRDGGLNPDYLSQLADYAGESFYLRQELITLYARALALFGRSAEEDVVLALEAIQDPVSLFDPVYQDGGDAIYVMDQVRDERVSEDDWVRDLSIRQALEKLGERERNIIKRRFFQGRTQMEVAGEIGISQAQVSRLEKAALQQMRRYI